MSKPRDFWIDERKHDELQAVFTKPVEGCVHVREVMPDEVIMREKTYTDYLDFICKLQIDFDRVTRALELAKKCGDNVKALSQYPIRDDIYDEVLKFEKEIEAIEKGEK